MSYTDDATLALAILKLAEAQRRKMALLDTFLVFQAEDADEALAITALIDSADEDARGVDNGKHRETKVEP